MSSLHTPQPFSEALRALARERLTRRQRTLLLMLKASREPLSVTRFVTEAQMQLSCSKSALWNNIHGLHRAKLITYGTNTNRRPIALTPAGRYVMTALEENS